MNYCCPDRQSMPLPRTYTDPSVLAGIAAGEPWADPTMDPTQIDWTERRRRAAIPFPIVDGRPVNPYAPTGIRYGRNLLGHWGEQPCADAIVTATDTYGQRWLLMVERADGLGWACPGGYVDPGEDPVDAAFRELAEETGLAADRTQDHYVALPPRYVPDPRASDEAWMVTTPVRIDLGGGYTQLPEVHGRDDARRAAWLPAASYPQLVAHLANDGGDVFPAHRELLADVLSSRSEDDPAARVPECCICEPDTCAADESGEHCTDRGCPWCLWGCPAPAGQCCNTMEETR